MRLNRRREPLVARTLVPLAAAAAYAAACAGAASAPRPAAGVAPACTFTNPILRGADPSVVRHGGFYYLVQSRDTGGIVVSRSDRLEHVGEHPVRVWTPPDTGWNRANVWAPELLFLDGRWYIYYAAAPVAGAPFVHQRSGVLQSVGDDPFGPYVDRGQLWTGDGPAPARLADSAARAANRWAIDLTVGRIAGRLYAVWSGWAENAPTDKTVQNLYIAPMANPWTVTGPRAVLSAPTAPWERGPELDLQEGPEFLQRGGRTFVVYSTRDSWLPQYELGMLRLKDGAATPLDSASWVKTGPVFASANGVVGVGHHAFTRSPDGREDWLVYHAKTSTRPGWDRVIRAQRFTWTADGTPSFGAPVPSGVPVPVPSGECR